MYNNREVVELLLQEGADAAAKDKAKRNALEYARLYGHGEVTAVLEHWELMLSKVVKGGKT
jgi:ankyrin repeat protein